MKVLFVANIGQIGGATNCLFTLANSLNKAKKIEPIILISKKGNLTNMCDKANIKYIILKFDAFVINEGSTKIKKIIKKFLFPIFKLRNIILNKAALNKIDNLIDMNEIDIIHTNVNRDNFGAILSKKYNIPHVWHLREFGDIDYKCLYYNKNYINYMNQNTDYFISVSNAIRNNFIIKGLDINKIYTIYDGISKFSDYDKKFSKNQLKILFMGGIQESKGQIQLIEALHLLSSDVLKNIKVDFYGNGSLEYIKKLKEKINEYKLNSVFKFNGYSNNLNKEIKKYDIGIMCSKCEAFGMVTIEYMANKLITIVSNTGASPEIVTSKSGFIYEYNNYQSLANIIKKIYYMDEITKKEISNNAFERSKYFSEEKTIENILKLYKKIIK